MKTVTFAKNPIANIAYIESHTNAQGTIVLDGLSGLDSFVAVTGATYTISHGSYKRGNLTFPDGTEKSWAFVAR